MCSSWLFDLQESVSRFRIGVVRNPRLFEEWPLPIDMQAEASALGESLGGKAPIGGSHEGRHKFG